MLASSIATVLACGPPSLGEPEISAWAAETGDPARVDDADSGEGSPVALCEGVTALRYAPLVAAFDAFPDDLLAEAADTDSGQRLRPVAAGTPDDPWLQFPSVRADLQTLTGFATTGSAYVRFTAPIDPTTLPTPGAETEPSASVVLVALDDPADFVEFDWRILDEEFNDDRPTLFIDPLRPLRSQTTYALAVTTRVHDAAGGCIAPSEPMADLLTDAVTDPVLTRTADDRAAALEVLAASGVIDGVGDLTALVTFTTREGLADTLAIAEAIAYANPPPITVDEGCLANPTVPYRQCDFSLRIADFTNASGVVEDAPNPRGFIDIPVQALFPPSGNGPFPVVVFGHGLWGDRTGAWYIATTLAPAGFAVVAIDAPKHGDHPDAAKINAAFDLLGLTDDITDPFLPFSARDNFRQATFDKLQLLRRIEAGMDVDGDGDVDIDASDVHYMGISLGSVMAAPLLALAPPIRSAALVVGGVRLTDIVTSDTFNGLVGAVTPGMTDGARRRFLTVVQGMLEEGEPQLLAPHVLADRLPGFEGEPPQLLAQMVLDDAIVTNSGTAYLARARGLEVVGPEQWPIRGVPREGALPVAGNLGDRLTGGLFQYSHVLVDGTSATFEPATHENIQSDPGAIAQVLTFLSTAGDRVGASIVAPYP